MRIVSEYEVEGCWTDNYDKHRIGNESRCRNCGAILERVPKEKHFNSQYWRHQRNDGLFLYCCPEGCSVKDADKKMRDYHAVANFCKEGSESYNYVIDMTKFKNAWIDRNGRCYPVAPEGHIAFAERVLKSSELELEAKGWAKISKLGYNWSAYCSTRYSRGFSKKQLDTIFDYCVANNISTNELFDSKYHWMFDFKED